MAEHEREREERREGIKDISEVSSLGNKMSIISTHTPRENDSKTKHIREG
jgi:hypothetical protein